ncbi:MAG: hypothetical protein AAFU41_05840 [Pseudomonadota bacterium]
MKLLLVSADQKITSSCREILASMPTIEFTSVSDAGAALAVLGDQEYGASHVLVDLGLPNSSGLIVCNTVGKSPQFSETKLWTIDAGKSADLFKTAHQLGAERNLLREDVPDQILGRTSQANTAKSTNQSASHPLQTPLDTDPSFQKLTFADKVRIGGVRNCLSRSKFDAYFEAMSKPERFSMRIVAIEISNAETIFPKVTPDVFLEILQFVARKIIEHFHDGKSRLTYSGNGIFICAFSGQTKFDLSRLAETIHRSSPEAEMSLRFVLDKIAINIGPVKRVTGVFRSHYEHHGTNPSTTPERETNNAPTVPVTPRKPRIQTRLLRAEDQIALPGRQNGI